MSQAFVIQLERDGDWRNVTSVRIESHRSDPDGSRGRRAAYESALRQLTGWQAYDGFFGMRLRIAEQASRYPYEFAEAVRP